MRDERTNTHDRHVKGMKVLCLFLQSPASLPDSYKWLLVTCVIVAVLPLTLYKCFLDVVDKDRHQKVNHFNSKSWYKMCISQETLREKELALNLISFWRKSGKKFHACLFHPLDSLFHLNDHLSLKMVVIFPRLGEDCTLLSLWLLLSFGLALHSSSVSQALPTSESGRSGSWIANFICASLVTGTNT